MVHDYVCLCVQIHIFVFHVYRYICKNTLFVYVLFSLKHLIFVMTLMKTNEC